MSFVSKVLRMRKSTTVSKNLGSKKNTSRPLDAFVSCNPRKNCSFDAKLTSYKGKTAVNDSLKLSKGSVSSNEMIPCETVLENKGVGTDYIKTNSSTLEAKMTLNDAENQSKDITALPAVSGTELIVFDADDVELNVMEQKVSTAGNSNVFHGKDMTPTTLSRNEITVDTAMAMNSKLISDPLVKRMKEEITVLIRECVAKDEIIERITERERDLENKLVILEKQKLQADKNHDKIVHDLTEAKTKMEDLQKKLKSVEAKVKESGTLNTQLKSKTSKLEAKLKMAANTQETLQLELEELTKSTKHKEDRELKKMVDMRSENNILREQKKELLGLVKKQMQLTHNLRRQILHLKVGFAHKFTEAEVLKAIEKGI